MTPSLGSINLLEQLTELRETIYLLDCQFIVEGYWASQVALVVKNPPANAGDVRDVGSAPVLGRSPGGGHGITAVFLPGESCGQSSPASYGQ